jgi:hypothetical protein
MPPTQARIFLVPRSRCGRSRPHLEGSGFRLRGTLRSQLGVLGSGVPSRGSGSWWPQRLPPWGGGVRRGLPRLLTIVRGAPVPGYRQVHTLIVCCDEGKLETSRKHNKMQKSLVSCHNFGSSHQPLRP